MRNKQPALSIVTIAKEATPSLWRTVESTIAFRDAGVEQVVVVDGIPGRLDQPEMRLEHVRWLHRSARGIADAFEAGLGCADSEWVWFLNGGDAVHEELDPMWLLSYLESTSANAVFGAVQFDGEPTPRPMPLLKEQWPLVVCWPLHPGAIVRRSVLIDAGGFDPRWRVAMDFDLWFRVLNGRNRVDVISVCLARFDTSGVSERQDTRRLARREAASVLVAHSGAIFQDLVWTVARTSWKWLCAVATLLGLR